MIRRKLTRIEVTLDDTKELDDLFLKTPQIGPLAAGSSTSSSIPKLSNLSQQKQISFLGKKFELSNTNDSTLDPGSLATNSNAANSTINTVVGDNQAANQSSSNLNEPETRFLYNPQPYNPSSSRFSQDN